MKSNVCTFRKGEIDLTPILTETEKVTTYNGLQKKQALGLRLLAEELVSMLPALVRNFSGEFWIENEGPEYLLNVRMSVEDMDISTRDELIRMSTNQKNSAAVGITGKICAVFDYMAMGSAQGDVVTPASKYGFSENVDFACLWSLQQYQMGVPKEETEQWDELEKSIIAKLSDDVLVGVRGKKVNVIIKKRIEEDQA